MYIHISTCSQGSSLRTSVGLLSQPSEKVTCGRVKENCKECTENNELVHVCISRIRKTFDDNMKGIHPCQFITAYNFKKATLKTLSLTNFSKALQSHVSKGRYIEKLQRKENINISQGQDGWTVMMFASVMKCKLCCPLAPNYCKHQTQNM